MGRTQHKLPKRPGHYERNLDLTVRMSLKTDILIDTILFLLFQFLVSVHRMYILRYTNRKVYYFIIIWKFEV